MRLFFILPTGGVGGNTNPTTHDSLLFIRLVHPVKESIDLGAVHEPTCQVAGGDFTHNKLCRAETRERR